MNVEESAPENIQPDLPDWGMYARWPQNGEQWIHPSDLAIAKSLIPSRRVFRRAKWDGEYYWLNYGEHCLRVQPTLWTRIPAVDLEVGQQVEVLSRNGENEAGIYRVREILFSETDGQLEYFLRRGAVSLERAFDRKDLRPLQERHQLHAGFFNHRPPKLRRIVGQQDALNVGDLLD